MWPFRLMDGSSSLLRLRCRSDLTVTMRRHSELLRGLAVPEPTTLALAGLGGLASLVALRRKQA